MAPRRGGGGSGGGGSGSSSLSDTPWGEMVRLPGTNFSNPYDTAQIVFQAIGVVGTIAIAIYALTFKKPHPPFTKIFRWWAFWFSITMLFIFCTIRLSTSLIYELRSRVQQIFFLIIIILYQSAYVAEISLLGILYLLLPHTSGHPTRADKPRAWKALQVAHALFIFGVLGVLWISAMALKIKYQVDFVVGDGYGVEEEEVDAFIRLDTVYQIFYFLGALEITVWAILGVVNRKQAGERKKVSSVFLFSVAAPLFLRSVYYMADVIYEELLGHYGSVRLELATDIVYILTTLVIYAGIVAICRSLITSQFRYANEAPATGYPPGHHDSNAVVDPKTGATVNETAPPVYQQGGWVGGGTNQQSQQYQQHRYQQHQYQQQQQQPVMGYDPYQPSNTHQHVYGPVQAHPQSPAQTSSPVYEQPRWNLPAQGYQQQQPAPWTPGYQPGNPRTGYQQPQNRTPEALSEVSGRVVGEHRPIVVGELPSPTSGPQGCAR